MGWLAVGVWTTATRRTARKANATTNVGQLAIKLKTRRGLVPARYGEWQGEKQGAALLARVKGNDRRRE
jgi:hypothetical protein